MKNEKIKQQETTSKCAICIIMRCAYKWMLVAGIISLISLLIAVIFSWSVTGEDEAKRWMQIWMAYTLLELILSGLFAIVTNWKDVYNWVCEELRCS